MLTPNTLLAAQIFAHLAMLPMILWGTFWHWLIAIFVYFLNGCIGMTMTYHRLLAHRSWNAPLWLRYFGLFSATIGMTGSALSWVAIHRQHHQFTDTEKDPHAPGLRGFIFCQWLSMYVDVDVRRVRDLLNEPVMVFQHNYYFFINGAYAAFLLMVDPFALVYAWLVPACILWNCGSLVVTIGHMWGSNPHKLTVKARNNTFLAFLVWGEGWHNNHHFAPQAAVFSPKLDVGGWIISKIDPEASCVSEPNVDQGHTKQLYQ